MPTVKPELGKTSGPHTTGVMTSTTSIVTGPGKTLATMPTVSHPPTLTVHGMTPVSVSIYSKGVVVKIGLSSTMTLTAGGVTTLSAHGVTIDVVGTNATSRVIALPPSPSARHVPRGLKTGSKEVRYDI